jgi:hypothetical protein
MAASATEPSTPETAPAGRRWQDRSPRATTALGIAGLLVVALVGYLWYLRNGGLYSDDWSIISDTLHPAKGGWWGSVEALWDRASYRPLSVAYYPVVYGILGYHATLELLWSVAVTFAFVALLFAVLRRVGIPAIHAFAISALVLVAPDGDSVVLWPSAAPIRFAGALYLGGLLVALAALRTADVRRARRRHAVALLLYLGSIWTYELTAALVGAGLLVYLTVAAPRRALKHWAADMVVAALAMAWTLTQTPKHVMTLQQQIDHARLIGHQLWDMYGGIAAPGWLPGHLAAILTIVLGVAALVAVVLMWRGRLAGDGFSEARRWAITGAIAFVYVIAAYVVFAPADFYYSPAAVNFGNRVNGIGIAPLILLGYAAVMVLATLVLAKRPRWLRAATALAVVYAVGMFLHHNSGLRDHQELYVKAWNQEQAVIGQLRTLLPKPPSNSYIITTGVAPEVARDLPVFYSTWDLQGAVRGIYEDGSLAAYNAFNGLQCTAQGIVIPGGMPAQYNDKTFIMDLPRKRVWTVDSPQACVAVVKVLSKPA